MIVAVTPPPIMGVAMRFMTSSPAPWLQRMGIRPARITHAVMAFGARALRPRGRSRHAAPQGCIKLGLAHAGAGLREVFPFLSAAPPDRADGCPPALSGALLGFTLLRWHNGHGNVGLTMAGGERWSVPQRDKEEAPAILLWYHCRYSLVPWYPHGTPRAKRDVLDSWNWLALEGIP